MGFFQFELLVMLSFSVRLEKEVFMGHMFFKFLLIFFFLKAAWSTELQAVVELEGLDYKDADNSSIECTIYKSGVANKKKEIPK